MTAAQRIFFNTGATYLRTALSVALGLFSGRWILEALGNVDYGLLGVVGGLFSFVAMLNGVASGTCARYFALAIGKGDKEEICRWFNTSLVIHTILPVVLVLVGLPVGEYLISNFICIPRDRLVTAHWVFRFSVLTSFVSMVTSPYIGMMGAKQNIAEMSFWSMGQTLANFCLVYLLLSYSGDRWMAFAIFTSFVTIFVLVGQAWRCRALYPECHVEKRYLGNTKRIHSILGFSGWQLFCALVGIFRGSFTAILINKYFPPQIVPSANASYSVSMTVRGYSGTLSSALLGAFSPHIIATEGSGNRAKMLSLASRASKFGTFLALLIVIPLSIEIDEVLVLWLRQPPEYASIFCLYMLIEFALGEMTYGQMVSVNAVGKIASYQIFVGGFQLLALPMAWLMYHCGGNLTCVGLSLVISQIFATGARLYFGQSVASYRIENWLGHVLIPIAGCVVVTASFGLIVKMSLEVTGFCQVIIVSAVTAATMAVCAWYMLFDTTEKSFFKSQIKIVASKIIDRW